MTGTESNLVPLLAVAQDLDSSLTAKLLFQVTGFIIVLSILAMLWGAIAVIGSLFKKLNLADPVTSPRPKPVPAPSAAPPRAELTPEHVAAIGAALHTVMKGPYRIVDIKEMPNQ